MKRTLLTAITLYMLYDRQKRVEARTKAWQRALLSEFGVYTAAVNEECGKFARRVSKSHERTVEEVEAAFKGIAGGKR